MIEKKLEPELAVRLHRLLLGHEGYGVTELRTFGPKPLVAYTDTEGNTVRLAMELNTKVTGIYIGVQPRPLSLFDNAPNRWMPAVSRPKSNCGCDKDIEFITTCFWDIDVVSDERAKKHPASDKELRQSLQAAKRLSAENGLALSSTLCCSGNGHYVLAPISPVSVDDNSISTKFKHFCSQLAATASNQVGGVKIDPVYNLSRVMRLMGTVNQKGQPAQDRPHRRAHFVTELVPAKSMALHHMIINTEMINNTSVGGQNTLSAETIRCDLGKIEKCEFIRWCRKHPMGVTEPLWFAMATNLAHLKGGPELIHEISQLDMFRYDSQQTQRLIDRIQKRGYHATNCTTLRNKGFCCPKFGQCPVKTPMYLTRLPSTGS